MAVSRTARPLTKLRQLFRLVRESHQLPLTGSPRQPEIVPPTETAITFIGHSSFLLQLAGKIILIDPVFATSLILLRRQRRPGLNLAGLPPIDLVLITHAHMDHLNLPSLRSIARHTRNLRGTAPTLIVPTGVDDLTRNLGFARTETLSWWDHLTLLGPEANLTITMTPARHWGARMFKDTHRHFGGYCISPAPPSGQAATGPTIYHSGDTAYFPGFHEIARRLHPDIALLPIGAYFPDSYRGVHTSPEEAVRAFLDTGAHTMIPMHFGTFRLGREPMHEPLERLAAEATRLHLTSRIHPLAEGETLRLPTRQSSVACDPSFREPVEPLAEPRSHAKPLPRNLLALERLHE